MGNQNIFTCEICRKAPKRGQWRRTYQWKTEIGFKNHHCYAQVLEEHKRIAENNKLLFEKRQVESLHKIGETVYFVVCSVTKPCYEQRGSRMVRVRYEEERRYSAKKGTIDKIILEGYVSGFEAIRDSDIFPSMEEAKIEAERIQKYYDEGCAFAERCR